MIIGNNGYCFKLDLKIGGKNAIAHSMGRNGLAIFMTSVTTAVGLASFLFADLAPVAHLEIAAPLGIFLAFIYTIILLPAMTADFFLVQATC